MECRDVRPLIPVYLDGELTEAQAAPLRQHLMDCPACRSAVQDERSLKAWFVEQRPVEVPAGFAARVARRALAGDTGERFEAPAVEAGEGRLLAFVLQVTTVAAGLLIALAIGTRALRLPDDGRLQADDFDLGRALEQLDELNDAQRGTADTTPSAQADEQDIETGSGHRP